ncbi:redoxin [Tenacibaculum holothuriorum]|uniref:Redoxin n=1 Tax=Tenacibaculum holothuriorum TaxID=1635173 RepID=A0A1Y2PG03_9FLAO|nr:TlpA disulfide reductase family protein [Tenacibaculum holothuriorum]OSY89426.1 redoxin [Tenacibaculum holothuriorum]
MKKAILFLLVTILVSCNEEQQTKLSKGIYKAELTLQGNQVLPFMFEVFKEDSLEVYNAEEKIKVTDITYKNDSVYIQTPVFEGFIAAKISNNFLNGHFSKPTLQRVVPFTALRNSKNRFEKTNPTTVNITGNWETVFSPNNDKDKYIAKGIFSQDKEGNVTGTFRTTTGDYRYLEGIMDGDSLKLSTFDGAHAFLFVAKATDSTLNGNFYSGNHWKEPFTAKLNNSYELPKAEELTQLKEGFDTFNFSFPNEKGELVSYTDEKFKNKVVIVQIMGSWCPNCLDESKYYVEYLKNNPNPNLEFVSLAFELDRTPKQAFQKINRLKEEIGINYPVLLAQYGGSDKKEAAKKLPMLNHILSYPTTIFIDKKGKVRKIHTGFNGPATGNKYTEFKTSFKSFVNQLTKE